MEQEQQAVLEIKDDITYYYLVLLLSDGSTVCERHRTEEAAQKDWLCKKMGCDREKIVIIKASIIPSKDPNWGTQYQEEMKKRLPEIKQELLRAQLSGRQGVQAIFQNKKQINREGVKTLHETRPK